MCSVSVSADETYIDDLKVVVEYDFEHIRSDTGEPVNTIKKSFTFYPNNGVQEYESHEDIIMCEGVGQVGYIYSRWKFYSTSGYPLLQEGHKTKVNFENGYYNVGFTRDYQSTYIIPPWTYAIVYYSDGTEEYIDTQQSSTVGRPTSFSFTFTPQKNVTSIEFSTASDGLDINYWDEFWLHMGEFESDNSYNLYFDTQSEEAGLLTNIIEFIKRISNSIVNLPKNIWNSISDGLKSLFVPTEAQITEFKEKMNTLLEQKLGAIYQVVNILVEGWDRIQANDNTNTIDFPEVTIPLPDDNEFSFGGQSVPIVPEGFDFLSTAIKLITGICCTILFVNGLKKRYDEIMGGQ